MADGVARGIAASVIHCPDFVAGRMASEEAGGLPVFVVVSVTDQAAGLPIGRVHRATALETVGARERLLHLQMVHEPGWGAAALVPDWVMTRALVSAMAVSQAPDQAGPIVADCPVTQEKISVIPATMTISAIDHQPGEAALLLTRSEMKQASAALLMDSAAARAMIDRAIHVAQNAPRVATTEAAS